MAMGRGSVIHQVSIQAPRAITEEISWESPEEGMIKIRPRKIAGPAAMANDLC